MPMEQSLKGDAEPPEKKMMRPQSFSMYRKDVGIVVISGTLLEAGAEYGKTPGWTKQDGRAQEYVPYGKTLDGHWNEMQ